jgi:cell fate regulator YaaT (PSP1 superfamily)
MGENVFGSSHGPPARAKDASTKRGHKIKWEEEPQSPRTLPCKRTVHIRVRFGGQIQAYEAGDLELDIGDWVVVRQGEITRLGLVTTKPIIWPANQGQKKILLAEDRQILRLATSEDLTKQAENQLKERDDYAYCQSCVNHLGLSMKLVAVEITLDNYKTIFYYTAEERVDFRQLVRELVSRFRTRIEMRQIGVRLEALKLGGLGLCGRCFCCSSFLSNFCQVSVKMAKEQRLSLNTAKISGVCGRLMCCLSFENYARNVKAQAGARATEDKTSGPLSEGLTEAESEMEVEATVVEAELEIEESLSQAAGETEAVRTAALAVVASQGPDYPENGFQASDAQATESQEIDSQEIAPQENFPPPVASESLDP